MARVELGGSPTGLADLLDDVVFVAAVDDALVRHRYAMVAGRVDEVRRFGPHALVVCELDADDLRALRVGALADERDGLREAVVTCGRADPLVRGAEDRVIAGDALGLGLGALRHAWRVPACADF